MAQAQKTIVRRPVAASKVAAKVPQKAPTPAAKQSQAQRPAAPAKASAAPAKTAPPVKVSAELAAKTKLQAELAVIANELIVLETALDESNQAQIWQDNTAAVFDSFAGRSEFKALIAEAEALAKNSRAFSTKVGNLVTEYREKRRVITRQLGVAANEKVVANMHKEEVRQLNRASAANNVKTVKTAPAPAPSGKVAARPQTVAAKAQPATLGGFRKFVESKDFKWPVTSKHPKYAALRAAYEKLS